MGSSRVWQGNPAIPTNTACVTSSQAAPCPSTAAAPGLSQWSLVEASFATATAASTVRVYQRLEDQLAKAGSATEDILALTTTREGATNLRNYFSIADKKANAETAVKVAGATAKHCIVIHGVSTFLSGEGRHLDYDQECFTRANVAYSRATDLTILACPLNMQGMPGPCKS